MRNKKIVLVSHCILNQNSKPLGKEKYLGMVSDIVELFSRAGVGIVQLPCPELEYDGGLNRSYKLKSSYDLRYRRKCKKLSSSILKQIKNYLKSDYHILAILGVEFSPTCAVHMIENGRKNIPGKGILIEELENEMNKKNFQVPIIGINLNNIENSIRKVQMLLKYCDF